MLSLSHSQKVKSKESIHFLIPLITALMPLLECSAQPAESAWTRGITSVPVLPPYSVILEARDLAFLTSMVIVSWLDLSSSCWPPHPDLQCLDLEFSPGHAGHQPFNNFKKRKKAKAWEGRMASHPGQCCRTERMGGKRDSLAAHWFGIHQLTRTSSMLFW